MQQVKSEYTAKLDGNILVIGPTNSGKTSLIQHWAVNNFFGENKKTVYWTNSLRLSSTCKNEIDSYFQDISLKFVQVSDCDKLEMFLEDLKNITDTNNNNDENSPENNDDNNNNKGTNSSLGENNRFKSLVIFDDMSTIPDKSKAFSHFLMVS